MECMTITLPQTGARLSGYLHTEMMLVEGRERRPCVVLCAGGGYQLRSPREEDPPALAFFARGYQVFQLDYTVMDEERALQGKPLGLEPLRELSEAVMYLRQNPQEYRVAPDKIAVCGFSAGGHLCASLGVLWDAEELKGVQDTRAGLNRPDAMILCYPVITGGAFAHQGSFNHLAGEDEVARRFFSLEAQVTPGAAPAFLWHTVEDATVPVENTLLMATALQRNGVPFECHIFPQGIHGLSMCNLETNSVQKRCGEWFPLCMQWLNGLFRFEE